MKILSTRMMALGATSCVLLLCTATTLTMPCAITLLSIFAPTAVAEDHITGENDNDNLNDIVDTELNDTIENDLNDAIDTELNDISDNDINDLNEDSDSSENEFSELEEVVTEEENDNDPGETGTENADTHTDAIETGSGHAGDMHEAFDNQGFIVQATEILAINADDTSLELIEELGFTVLRQQSLDALDISIATIETPSGLSVRDAIERLRQSDPDALYEFNHLYAAMPAGDKLDQTPGTHKLSTVSAMHTNIGLIDTAVDTKHEALRDSHIVRQRFVDSDTLPMAHGTSIASLLVGNSTALHGLLPDATLYSAAVFTQSFSRNIQASADSLAAALNWLVKEHVPVINMSLAGPPNVLLQITIRKTLEKGHAIVAAVGNDGPAAPPLYPAAYPGVIAVTAVDARRHVYRRANRGKYVDFSAPGVKVLAADQRGGYGTFSGTSYAAPVISALLARQLRAPDRMRQQHAFAQLQQQTIDIGSAGRDPVFGYGLLGEALYAKQ